MGAVTHSGFGFLTWIERVQVGYVFMALLLGISVLLQAAWIILGFMRMARGEPFNVWDRVDPTPPPAAPAPLDDLIYSCPRRATNCACTGSRCQ